MTITSSFTEPFYEGAGSTIETPSRFDLALNGRGYMFDEKHPAWKEGIRSIPLIRSQADTNAEPSDASMNREDLWQRSQTTWHKGGGQAYFDDDDSDRARFRRSFNVNVWERGKLSLLNSVEVEFEAQSVRSVLRVGDDLFVAVGNQLYRKAGGDGTATSVVIHVAETPQTVRSITSDGNAVYAALGSNGVHYCATPATVGAHYSNLAATLVRYVKGRLMAANGNAIYNIITAGAAPSALFTHPNTDFTWVDFTNGRNVIYAAGYSGDKSLIYRTAVKSDGTGLDVPVVAGELPDGEIVRSVCGYLGFLLIGTDRGFRLATQDANGDLTLGALVDIDRAVYCFEPQGRFVWFGWNNWDGDYTGVGRMDLTQISDEGAPAYASDLVANDQGNVISVATRPDGKTVFAVENGGLYTETDTRSGWGYIETGAISFGLQDPKIAMRATVKHLPLGDGDWVMLQLSADNSGLTAIGISDNVGSTSTDKPMRVAERTGQLFELRVELANNAVLEHFSFRAYPVMDLGRQITLPILMHERVVTAAGGDEHYDVRRAYEDIEGLVGDQRLVSLQYLGATYSVFVTDVKLEPYSITKDRRWVNGTIIAVTKVLGG